MVLSKNVAPFSSNVKRFGRNTQHPNLDPHGHYKTPFDGCNPCLYSPQPLHKIYEVNKNRTLEPWKCKLELENWAKNLGYSKPKILAYRKWQRSVLGPAWHEVIELPKCDPACKNVGFGRTPRWKQPKSQATPGPGNYYKPVPYKAPYGPHSTRPTLEREEPCRFKDPCPKWSLAPNRYKIIDKESIAEKSNKIVSLRGPYDLFTGKRDNSTIKNHFNKQRVAAATWPLALKGGLNTYEKSHYGEMNKTNRSKMYRGRNALVDISMCYRRPEDPGPGTYEVDMPKVFVQNKAGFNSSFDRPPGYQRTEVWPAVGRYKPIPPTCGIIGHGHRHVFLSKTKRTIGANLPETYNTF